MSFGITFYLGLSMTHPHAEVLRAIADGVPLSEFELTCHPNEKDVWDNMGNGTKWGSWIHNPEKWLVRRKPRTHVVNGFTVPAPMDKEPSKNDDYFTPYFHNYSFAQKFGWFDDCEDRNLFKRGLCFATKKAAIANAKAMLKIDPEAA